MKTVLLIAMLICVGLERIALADEACFDVQGMTCATCSITLKTAVKKLKGIHGVTASVEKKTAEVQFNSKETDEVQIKKAIDDIGYKATAKKCENSNG